MNALRQIVESMTANAAEIDRKMSAPATVKYVTDPRFGCWIKKDLLEARNAFEAEHGRLNECGDGRMHEEDRDLFIAFCNARGVQPW